MKRIITFLSSLTLVAVFFTAAPALAAGEGSITLSPATGTVATNSTIQVQVRYGGGTQSLVGVNAIISYNPALLSTSTSAVTINTADLNLAPPVIINNTAGTVEVGAAKTGTTGTVQANALLATITFTAKAAGTAALTVSQSQSQVNIYDSNTGSTQNILGSVSGASITVTGTGGGGGGTTDTTAPIISGETAGTLTSNSAKISWTTSEATTGKVDYGTTTSYGSSVAVTTSGTSHSATLTGLAAGTKYYYRVTATDAASNSASGQALSFTTTAASGGTTGNTTGGTSGGTTGGTSGGTTGGTTSGTTSTPLTAPVTGAGQWIAVIIAIVLGILAVVLYASYAIRRDKKKAASGALHTESNNNAWQ